MRTEHLFSSLALPPYLGVPQFDIHQSLLGSDSDSGTHPSILTAALNAWRDQVLLSQDPQVCSRAQLTLSDISDEEGRNGRTLDYTHTHTCTLQTDRHTMHTHTHRRHI